MTTATPHPTVTTFLRWADLCVAICGDRIEPAAARIAIEAARYRVNGRTTAIGVSDGSTLAGAVSNHTGSYDVEQRYNNGAYHSLYYRFGALTAVAIFDGEDSRAYIATSNPIADVLTVGS
jgi:hypothetical protein